MDTRLEVITPTVWHDAAIDYVFVVLALAATALAVAAILTLLMPKAIGIGVGTGAFVTVLSALTRSYKQLYNLLALPLLVVGGLLCYGEEIRGFGVNDTVLGLGIAMILVSLAILLIAATRLSYSYLRSSTG